MTDQLQFSITWEDPAGAAGEELRATWASLEIRVNGELVTEVKDEHSAMVRPTVTLPLYPLAEWIAHHWWFLLYEVSSAAKDQHVYDKRHNLQWGSEGFALPHLSIIPSGSNTQVQWQSVTRPAQQVRFLSSGTANIPSDEVRVVLSKFIVAVVTRLDDKGVYRTPLAEEWSAITSTTADETEFCRSAALLGVDPYAASGQDRDAILRAGALLPPNVSADFFGAASIDTLSNQVDQLQTAIRASQRWAEKFSAIKELRVLQTDTHTSDAPWLEGYALARTLRKNIGLNGEVLPSFKGLEDAFCLSVGTISNAYLESPVERNGHTQPPAFDALVYLSQDASPGFVITKRMRTSHRFAFCRILGEYLMNPEEELNLVTSADSDRQKRNRAFAAEFLAPASEIKKYLATVRDTDNDTIDDIAERFGVSPFVVKHQIENQLIR